MKYIHKKTGNRYLIISVYQRRMTGILRLIYGKWRVEVHYRKLHDQYPIFIRSEYNFNKRFEEEAPHSM